MRLTMDDKRVQSSTDRQTDSAKHDLFQVLHNKCANAKKKYSDYKNFKSIGKHKGFFFDVKKVYIKHFLQSPFKRSIIIQAWVKTEKKKFQVRNWGDDLNKHLIELMTGRRTLFIPDGAQDIKSFSLPKRYLFVGSILSFYNLNNSVIWGTGLMCQTRIIGTPKKVLMVRGPKTRQVLMEQGISCPECYGDPALLLPLFYEPEIKSQNSITVIIHENTPFDNEIIIRMKSNGCKVINMKNYNCWTDIIDTIVNSRFIISESLHGLIVAEAYGIPSVWVEFVQHPDFWSFKYQDYYDSIGKLGEESYKLYESYDWNSIITNVEKWQKGKIDYINMLNSFPIKADKRKKVQNDLLKYDV